MVAGHRGVPIDRVMFWVPHPGGQLGMGVSILSYCGYVSLAVVVDAQLVPDPEKITEQFGREFAVMLTLSKKAAGKAARPSKCKKQTG